MTYQEICKLHEMGFTPEQIVSLTTSAPIPSGTDDPGTGTNPVPVPVAQPAEAPAPDPAADISVPGEGNPVPSPDTDQGTPDNHAEIKAIREEIASLRSMIQANNIRDRTFTPAPEIPEVAAEDILSQLIRPVYDKKEDK